MVLRVRLSQGWPVRAVAVAVATVAYSTAITVSPRLLARPTGLAGGDGGVSPAVAALTRSIGVRDAALAGALALAPAGYPMRLLTAARVISDGADAVWFSRLLSDRTAIAKVAGAAAGWALLEAAVGWGAGGAP